MADELDRVRISAAELRAEVLVSVNHSDCHREDQGEEDHGQCQQQHHQNNEVSKHSDLQLYTPGAGHNNRRHDSEDCNVVTSPGHLGQTITSDLDVQHGVSPPLQTLGEEVKMATAEVVATKPVFTERGLGAQKGGRCFTSNRAAGSQESRQPKTHRVDYHTTGDADNNNNNTSCSSAKRPTGSHGRPQNSRQRGGGRDPDLPEITAGAPGSPKPTRKTRKPDREIYQPGGRRSATTKGKEPGADTVKPDPGAGPSGAGPSGAGLVIEEAQASREPPAQRDTGGEERRKDEKVQDGRGGEEKGRRLRRKEEAKAAVTDSGLEPLTGRMQKLSVTAPPGKELDENREAGGGQKIEGEEGIGRRLKASGEGRRSRAGGGAAGEGGEKTEKGRDRNRRNQGGDKVGNQNSRMGGTLEEGGRGERGVVGRDRRTSEGDRDKVGSHPGDAQPAKAREKLRETERDDQRGKNRLQDADRERDGGTKRTRERDGGTERTRERDGGTERTRERDGGTERTRERDGGTERTRDRDGGTERTRERDGGTERTRDRDGGTERTRDRDGGTERTRERDGGTERTRERDGGTERTRERDGGTERTRERDGGTERTRERDGGTERTRDRDGGTERTRERDGGTERTRDRDGGTERTRERDGGTERTRERDVNANPSNNNNQHHLSSSSKRYSKSDIRRPRNRTYSTSSASSSTSLDGPRQGGGLADNRARRDRLGRRERDRGEGTRGQRQNRRRNTRDSSTDSVEESKAEGRVDGRRRDGGEEDWRPERREEERRGAGGLLKVSRCDKLSGTPQAISDPSNDARGRRRQGMGPHGRGRGILILPAHTDLSNLPAEPGPRLLFGGIRGGREAGLGRGRGGGRGGGTRRLWDPNNPDQKPALRISQHATLQQQQTPPMYLQTGGAYGALHFLDTDDEAAGSPPVHQGEHLQQKAAAMVQAYYKYQNSDNPYPYNANPNTNTRYPFPYHAMPTGPYQIPTSNGVYPAQFYGGYRGQGGSGVGLTPEEAEQQARAELVRLLRAADIQESQLSNLLSRDRLSADGLDRMAQLRADLLTLYERVILTDIEFSDSQNLDQALWKNVFYQVIERFRQLLKDPSGDAHHHITTMLLTLLDEGALFFDALLQKLQTVFQFKLEDYMDGMAIRARPLRKTVKYALISAQRCLICQGDIARYREQASDSANYGKARSWYLKAQQIAPKNGRPYNQLALLAVYTKRKLDAVYYYMRSLAASNPILTAKESLMSLFEEAKRKADQMERRRRQDSEGGSRGPGVRGGRGEDGARVEIWVRPSGLAGAPSIHRGGSESSRDSEQEGELGNLSASDLNKKFILSFLYAHGKLFTKVGMESFSEVASRVLQEFRALLQHSPSPLGSTRLLQIITINMFTIHNSQNRGGDGELRSVLQEQTTALGLAMFAVMVQRCTELLKDTPAEPILVEDREEEEEEEEGMVKVSSFPVDLRELLPSIKVWSDWMLGHPDQWNPPPCNLESSPDVWHNLADLCNALARVDHGEAPLYKADGDGGEGDEEMRLLLLEEDRLLAGFVPLLAAPQEPCYIDRSVDTAIAADCKRVTVLKYFLEALCGQEEPLLAFKGGKYVSMATPFQPSHPGDPRTRLDSQTQRECDEVIVEAESSMSDGDEAGGSEDDIKELRARRSALTTKLAQHQKRRDKIQAVLQTCGQVELEVRPVFLVLDTNGFIDHLSGLKALLQSGTYILVVPLIVITELDGLAKGQESCGGSGRVGFRGNPGGGVVAHARAVQEKAKVAVAFLEQSFEAKEPCLRALTSRGSELDSIGFRSEDTSGQHGNNDDVILCCCLHYCKDKAKDLMPVQKDGSVRLRREVVLLTDDRNLRVKALTRNVPVRDIPAFLTWAKVG